MLAHLTGVDCKMYGSTCLCPFLGEIETQFDRILIAWITSRRVGPVMPSPGMKRFNHRRAEEPNNQPNVEIQLKIATVAEVLFYEKVYYLVSWPWFAFATSVVSRGKYGVDDDQGEIRRDGEEHDHMEGPCYAADGVDSLKRNDWYFDCNIIKV